MSFLERLLEFGLSTYAMASSFFSFAKIKDISVASFKVEDNLDSLFHLPLSSMALTQLQELRACLSDLEPPQARPDDWSYIWHSVSFTSKQAYVHLLGQSSPALPFIWLWSSSCRSKQKFLFWLLLKDRLNTRELLLRKQFPLDNVDCVLCSDRVVETSKHLFF